uniref:integrin alpha-IIb-like n=1 Tax=Oncorhynchus gorbuscha TaxID=8017 RepID=UPI001EAF071E|nr:integrin alpha-IIb-like [Oncorhynchus gorbuscha]
MIDVGEHDEAQNTPAGNCLVLNTLTGETVNFSPCRDIMTEKVYKVLKYSQIISAGLPDIVNSAKSQNAKPYVAGQTHSPETGGYNRYHDYVVGVPNDCNTAGSVASYFGHSVAVTDHRRDGILIGAPLFMEHVSGQQLQEVGQVSVYLQGGRSTFHSKPDQKLTGSQVYGRIGSTIAPLSDLDNDSFNDVAVGAPSSGFEGRVFISMGTSDGLSPQYTQVIESPFRSPGSPAQFGFTLRGATDIDLNGYPDLIVGAWGVNKIAVYRAQAVVMAKTQLSLYPDFLNPDVKECERTTTNEPVACSRCNYAANGQEGHVSAHKSAREYFQLTIQRDVGVVCRNQTAYLRHELEFKDKLSPIFISLNYSLSNSNSQETILHGQRAVVTQTRIILDCGEDNVCVPDLRLTSEARLICAQKKENQTVVVVCELGNPMRQGQKLQAGLLFSVGNLEKVESHVSFTLQIKSKNSQNPDSNVAHLRIDVSAEAALEMWGVWSTFVACCFLDMGSSPPECVLPIAKWEQKEQPADLEEVGPLVEHVYELVKTGNATVGRVYKVKQNEVEQPEPQHKDTVHVNCTSGDTCLRFVCEAKGLERDWSAVVKVMSRLWIQTFLERPYENYVLHSTARYAVIDMPSKIQPEELPSGQAETQTSLVWSFPDGEKEVPVWWIIVAVVSGLFHLALIFWKVMY